MLTTSNAKYSPCLVGTNITVPIPDVDSACGSFRNVIALVVDVDDIALTEQRMEYSISI